MVNIHRYILLLYFRIVVLTALCFGMLTIMLPKIIASENNNAWNNNAVAICANVTKTHTVQFYYTYSDPSYSNSEPYYDGYVIVSYLNYSYNFRKYSWYSNHTQLKSDLKRCCTIGMSIDIYYNKNNPADANSLLLSTYTFPLWISGLIGGLLSVFVCLSFAYWYDHRYYTKLLLAVNLAKANNNPYASGLLLGS